MGAAQFPPIAAGDGEARMTWQRPHAETAEHLDVGVAVSEEDKTLGIKACLQVCSMRLCEHQRRSAADRSNFSQQMPSPPSICLNICRSHKAWKQLRMRP